MSKVGAVHFNPKIQPHLQHNDRTNSNADNIVKELSHLNECDKSASQALREIDTLYKEAMSKLDEAKKKGKRTPKERSFHEAIFEINDGTTMKQCQELADRIAELTGFRKIQVSIHKDEGHTNEQGEFKPHYHAHAVFFTLDKDTGKQLARQEQSLNPRNLSKIQDIAAEVLQMKRGEKSFNEKEYQAFLDQKATRPKGEKIKYRPQAPKRIQNQDDFKRFKDQERELRKEIVKKEQEIALEKQKLEEERAKLIQSEKEAFKALEINFNKQKNFFKNLFTLGGYHKNLENAYKESQNALMASIKEVKEKTEQRIKHYETQLQLLEQEKQNQQRAYQARIQEQEAKLEAKDKRIRELETENAEVRERVLNTALKSNDMNIFYHFYPHERQEREPKEQQQKIVRDTGRGR
ncbi:mobilization protein (plasmid) [Helicobacter cinaedi]|uniref:hypothetical protein n=1 Tax=Helicobacter cinaedi TaxID=213 RepID=UPI001F2A4937|nr:hypothetical protein [Helicobacter cinaedi]BDB65816.1 mobilization protein [Helicobacter cinaedi]